MLAVAITILKKFLVTDKKYCPFCFAFLGGTIVQERIYKTEIFYQ